MNYMNKTVTVILLLLVVASQSFAGGGSRTGTGGAAELLIPVGTRGISMAGANISTASSLEAIFWNPAGLSRGDYGTSVSFSHMDYIADIGVEYGAVSTNVEGFGALAFSIKSLSIGDIAVTTAQDPDGTGKKFRPSVLVTGLSYARKLSDRISIGTTANLISETFGDVSSTGFSFNVGLIYEDLAEIEGLNFGIAMKNIGPQMRFGGSGLNVLANPASFDRGPMYYQVQSAGFELPSTFELGFSYKANLDNVSSILFAGTFQNNNYSGDEYKVGMEYSYQKMFYGRLGYQYTPTSQDPDPIYGFAAGAGFKIPMESLNVEIGYAYRAVEYFGANHTFEVRLGF